MPGLGALHTPGRKPILWALCSRLPFRKGLTDLISKPDIVCEIVEDDTELRKIEARAPDWERDVLLSAQRIEKFRLIKSEYLESEEWKKTEKDIKGLLTLLSGGCTEKIQRFPELRHARRDHSCPSKSYIPLRFLGRERKHLARYESYLKYTTSLISDYLAILQIQAELYEIIDKKSKRRIEREELKNYFGNWIKGPRKNLLLPKLLMALEHMRRIHNAKEKRKAFEASATEIPYLLAKTGIFQRLKCEYKDHGFKCSTITCIETRVKDCKESLGGYSISEREQRNFCLETCRRSAVTCPLKIPCPPGRKKYKNELLKHKFLTPITEL